MILSQKLKTLGSNITRNLIEFSIMYKKMNTTTNENYVRLVRDNIYQYFRTIV